MTKQQDSAPSPQSEDVDQWDDLASGKSFAMIHNGAIVFGREERDRSAWQDKVAAQPQVIEGASAAADDLDSDLGSDLASELDSPHESSPLGQLDRCMADLKNNHHRLAAYTEKSIRYLWQETRALLARHDSEIKAKLATMDQLALQNRSLKSENRALAQRLDSELPERIVFK